MPDRKNTEIRRTVNSPNVRISVSDYGSVYARLEAYRDKQGGGLESIYLTFEDMDMWSLACIAHSATAALRKLRAVQDAQIVQRLEFATGWSEGSGPGGGE